MTNSNEKNYVGVDISKNFFDVAIYPTDKHSKFDNNNKGYNACAKWIKANSNDVAQICLEATGGYERGLLEWLYKNKYPVARVNPRRVRDFAKAQNLLAKTDKIDAKVIAGFSAMLKTINYSASSVKQQHLREFYLRIQQLKQMIAAEKNRLEKMPKFLHKSIRRVIKLLSKEIESIQKHVDSIISQDQYLADNFSRIQSVKGVGKNTSAALLALIPELGQLGRKPIAALGGLAPFNKDSGYYKGKRIIWGGRQPVRNALYMAALVAAHHNPVIAEFYQRLLNKGKPKKLALAACMRKLLIIINTLVANQSQWQDNYRLNTNT